MIQRGRARFLEEIWPQICEIEQSYWLTLERSQCTPCPSCIITNCIITVILNGKTSRNVRICTRMTCDITFWILFPIQLVSLDNVQGDSLTLINYYLFQPPNSLPSPFNVCLKLRKHFFFCISVLKQWDVTSETKKLPCVTLEGNCGPCILSVVYTAVKTEPVLVPS